MTLSLPLPWFAVPQCFQQEDKLFSLLGKKTFSNGWTKQPGKIVLKASQFAWYPVLHETSDMHMNFFYFKIPSSFVVSGSNLLRNSSKFKPHLGFVKPLPNKLNTTNQHDFGLNGSSGGQKFNTYIQARIRSQFLPLKRYSADK